MVQRIKRKVWQMLEEKRVSLAMIYDRDGYILWHHGRDVTGKSVHQGRGFCFDAVQASLAGREKMITKGCRISSREGQGQPLSQEAEIRSVIIQPLNSRYFFYIDSGLAEEFSAEDRRVFQVIFEILDEVLDHIRHSQKGVGGITGSSHHMSEIREQVLRFSVEDEPVLLTGETGVGKNHIAALIHEYSGRSGAFVVAHTPAIPENLIEREFFGHRKGAFTDACSDRKGLIASAEGGTLFLDEITEVPVSFQAKLLRFIESGMYRALGDVQEQLADVRVISASNQDVASLVASKKFRKDLFYRIQVLQISIPPLRERPDDIRELVESHIHFLKGKEVTRGFWDVVLQHEWPGNIRELLTILKRAGILLESPITAEAIRYIVDHSCYRERIVEPGEIGAEETWRRLKSGENFWEAVRTPYLKRELNRREVVTVIDRALRLRRGRYRDVIELFNLKGNEYKKFMNFVHQHRLRPHV